MNTVKRLWREQRLVLIAFVVAAGLALFFGGRIVARAIYWSNPAHQRQEPAPWMTPGYIARSWHLHVEEIDAILGIQNGPELVREGPPTLERIAAVLGVPVSELIDRLTKGLPAAAAATK